uniref:Breast cancer anti-estrogen resistance protein 1 n=1 Tax=Strigamia maritima TaxID=126957 RepID=T1IHI4_STRMM
MMQSLLTTMATTKDIVETNTVNSLQNCLAKAVYDNIAESPDELAFRKGDVLTVLEQNTNGLEGWWLCALRGRQGICPGNRLRLLAGMYDAPVNPTEMTNRRSCQLNPNKVITPQKVGDVYFYDIVKGDEYDVPPTCKMPADITQLTGSLNSLQTSESYDIPMSHKLAYDVPKCHVKTPSPVSSIHESFNHGSKTKSEQFGTIKEMQQTQDYDVPRGSQFEDSSASYDVPQSHIITVRDPYKLPTSHVPSNRSSGVSLLSIGSSAISPSSSACSLTPSLSLSSLGGTGSNRSSLDHQHELYDIPSSQFRKANTLDEYDSPQNKSQAEFYDTPPKPKPAPAPAPAQGMSDGVYDVPPQVTRDTGRGEEDVQIKRLSTSSIDSMRDNIPLTVHGKELPLELAAAMDTLIRLQQQVHSAISKLFSFVSSTWRQKENLENKIYDIKLCCKCMQTALQEFLDFSQGTLVNSTHASDKMLSHKLARLVTPIRNSNDTIHKICKILDAQGWSIAKLAVTTGMEAAVPDELDQLVACARELTEDVRQVASFIQGNSTLLFKRSGATPNVKTRVQERPLPPPPSKPKEENEYENDSKGWIDDYDYVNLESKNVINKENDEIKAALPQDLRKSFDNIIKESEIPVENVQLRGFETGSSVSQLTTVIGHLDVNDRQVLKFYASQIETHVIYLTNAIDAFLATIENNQPPKIFIGHSKFVVLSAHKLVYIGDTVHRNIVNIDVRNKVLLCSNALCDALTTTVKSTKMAAQQFPSVIAVQEMVDSVVDISHSANDLKTIIVQAGKL